MACDDDLAARVREVIMESHEMTEQKMFGGLAFMIGGHMAVAASHEGLMVRVEPESTQELLATTEAEPMVMRDHPMRGWVRVPAKEVRTEAKLREWVARGVDYASVLPPKSAKQK